MSHAPTTTATPAATAYGFHCGIDDKDFARAVARVTEALKTEGFGVLTEVAAVAHEVRERLQRVKALLTAPSAASPQG